MIVSQPVLTNTTRQWFSDGVKVSITHLLLFSEGACSMLPGLIIILHLKYSKKVYIRNNLFIFVSKKSVNFK